MLPVEADISNQLEEGYLYNRPWTQTWQDELNSCVEAGAEGEAKAVHRLWPEEKLVVPNRKSALGRDSSVLSSDLPTSSPSLDTTATAKTLTNRTTSSTVTEADNTPPKKFAKSSVIYVDAKNAQILRLSLLPSLTRGRTPLGPIRKGRQIGVAVIRGFDYKAWERLHPPKKTTIGFKAQEGAAASQSGAATTIDRRKSCGACLSEEERPRVTDLVLVIHGCVKERYKVIL